MNLFNRLSYGLAIATSSIALFACSHAKVDKEIDQKVAQKPEVLTSAQVGQESVSTIDSAPGLTSDQRTDLKNLGASTRTQLDQLKNESLRLRGVLVDSLVSTNYNATEINQIKKRIKTTEEKRVSVLFDAVDNANKILGHSEARKTVFTRMFNPRVGTFE